MNDTAPVLFEELRPPPSASARPVYVCADGAKVGKNGELVEIALPDGARHGARLAEVSEVVLGGNVILTTPCLHEFLRRGIPVSWCTGSGWLLGQARIIGFEAQRLAAHLNGRAPLPDFSVRR